MPSTILGPVDRAANKTEPLSSVSLHSSLERHKRALGIDKSYEKNKIAWGGPAFEIPKEIIVSSGKCCQKVKYGVRCSGMSIRFPNMKMVGDLGRGG